jgi:hypothetical protein
VGRSWTLHDYQDWQDYCREVAPPVNIAMAAQVGFKPKRKREVVEADDFDIDEFLKIAQQYK